MPSPPFSVSEALPILLSQNRRLIAILFIFLEHLINPPDNTYGV